MPISPKQAKAAKKKHDKPTTRLLEDIDEQLRNKGEASIWKPSDKYSFEAIHEAKKIYKEKGWKKITYQPAGQFDVEEVLIIR